MLSHLCAAFLKLSTAYATGAKQAGKSSTRDIVLQIVPLNFLAHCDCLVIPPPKAYTKLAFEVYSRCCPAPCSDGTMPSPFTSGSAIRLAKPIPKNVSFQISMQPPVGLLSSDPSLHLAYSWDFNQQWLACAWIDNLGLTQWNAAYCLGDPESDHWAAFAETVKEILDTTKDMLQPSNLPWRLYVVKDNGMYQQELEGEMKSCIRPWSLGADLMYPSLAPSLGFCIPATDQDHCSLHRHQPTASIPKRSSKFRRANSIQHTRYTPGSLHSE